MTERVVEAQEDPDNAGKAEVAGASSTVVERQKRRVRALLQRGAGGGKRKGKKGRKCSPSHRKETRIRCRMETAQ